MRLTKDEVLLIAVIVGALLIGAVAKHYRETHRAPLPATEAALQSKVVE